MPVTEFKDFAAKASSGTILPNKMDGKGVQIYRMVPKSSTKASKVPVPNPPTDPNPTNPFYLASVGNIEGTTLLEGVDLSFFLLDGTDQGHYYGGLMARFTKNMKITGAFVLGVPGIGGEPPGETFSINVWHALGALLENCGCDGRGISSSLFGLNNAEQTILRGCTGRGNRGGTALTSWKSGGITVDDFDARGSHRGFNIEQPTGAHTYNRPDLRGTQGLPHFTCNSNERSIPLTIRDPRLDQWPLLVGVDTSGKPFYGKKQLQRKEDVHVILNNVDVTKDPKMVKFGWS